MRPRRLSRHTPARSVRALGVSLVLALCLPCGCGDEESALEDAGAVTDAGNPPADAGHLPADAGSDDRDAGPGQDDGGATPTDAGHDAGLPEGTHPDIVRIIDVPGRDPGSGWHDSYSVGSQCYCETTFDHNIGDIEVDTPVGTRTVREVCDAIGPGPGSDGRPLYNDIQCGNGPANDAGDEDDCPGRVDIGREGCGHIGPTWDLSVLSP